MATGSFPSCRYQRKMKTAWPELAYQVVRGGVSSNGQVRLGYLELQPTPPQIPPRDERKSPKLFDP